MKKTQFQMLWLSIQFLVSFKAQSEGKGKEQRTNSLSGLCNCDWIYQLIYLIGSIDAAPSNFRGYRHDPREKVSNLKKTYSLFITRLNQKVIRIEGRGGKKKRKKKGRENFNSNTVMERKVAAFLIECESK